jgi:hypothetical protein
MLRYALPILLLMPAALSAQTVTVTGGKLDATDVVIRLPENPSGNKAVAGQVGCWVQPDNGGGLFVIPSLKAGEKVDFKFISVKRDQPVLYSFKETPGEYVDLLYGDKPVMRYVNKPRDAKDHYMTFKPFHQVFDPTDGKAMLSSGAHPLTKEFVFPHHRGIYFGFNKISYGEKQTADIWHGTKNVFSTHVKMKASEVGEVFAKQTAEITWNGEDAKTFANETRTVIVYNVAGGTLIDWSTELTTELEKVRLDGDPQHAGFHFRAAQDVAQKIETEKDAAKKENRKPMPAATYYLRPDGKGKEGETRNWDAKGKDPKTVNLPWDACSFVTSGKRYTALRINHPDNPKEARGSERDYGRFGDYFEYDLTPKTPLKLKYRVWVQEGEMTVEQCAALAAGFQEAPKVEVAK